MMVTSSDHCLSRRSVYAHDNTCTMVAYHLSHTEGMPEVMKWILLAMVIFNNQLSEKVSKNNQYCMEQSSIVYAL